MVNLSKSKYCALWQCPKMLWLRKYKPELAEVDSHTLSIMETGNAVGDLAMGLFGDFTEVTVYTDGEIDLPAMMRRTQEEIAKDTPVICEASFEWNGLYCAVDILRREGDGHLPCGAESRLHLRRDAGPAKAVQGHRCRACGGL